MNTAFWLALAQVVWIDLLLSGDNALVIAMATQGLDGTKRLWGMILGTGLAIVLRIIFAFVITFLVSMPYLGVAGAIALLFVAVKMVMGDDGDSNIAVHDRFWRAVGIIAVADLTMSLDNIIAISGTSGGSFLLLVLGLVISIPIVITGANLISKVLDRAPLLIWAGGALLGWIAGGMVVADHAVVHYLHAGHAERVVVQLSCAAFVVLFGWILKQRGVPAVET